MALLAILSAAGFGVATLALATPAPWHWWKSRLDGRLYCAQTSPGSGWLRVEGPFDNAQCMKRDGDKAGTVPRRVPKDGAPGAGGTAGTDSRAQKRALPQAD